MSKYTMEVREIVAIENKLSEREGYNNVDSLIANCWNKIFDNFPIFDETYREVLAKKIIRHFYTREICAETVGLWKLWLNNRMNEIMPYYNKLYESELIKFNPLYDVDLKRTGDNEKTGVTNSFGTSGLTENGSKEINEIGSGSTSGTETNNNTENITNTDSESNKQSGAVTTTNNERDTMNGEKWDLFSNTPQGALSNVKQGRYLTTAENIEDSETNVKEGSSTSINDNENEIKRSSTVENATNTERNTTEINEAETKRNETNEKTRDNTNSTNKNISNVEDYFEHLIGKRGSMSYSKMLEEFRKTFLNIDLMIINNLEDLFFALW